MPDFEGENAEANLVRSLRIAARGGNEADDQTVIAVVQEELVSKVC